MWLWRFIVITIISVFIYIITFNYLNADLHTEHIESGILKTKLLYSDSCLRYKNPGEIDLEKLNDNRLKSCYLKSNLGYRLTLFDLNEKEIRTAKSMTNEQELQLAFCKQYKCTSSNEYVLYKEDNGLKPGILKIEAVKS